MEVILLKKISNLGGVGDTVKVKSGFARNYLFPQQHAVPANEENLKKFEARRAELEKAAAEELATAQARAAKISELKTIALWAPNFSIHLLSRKPRKNISSTMGPRITIVKTFRKVPIAASCCRRQSIVGIGLIIQ